MFVEEVSYENFKRLSYINKKDQPYVVRGLAKHAPFGKWSIEHLANLKGNDLINYKIGVKGKYCSENECLYIDATLNDFVNKLNGAKSSFDKLSSDKYWVYADYKEFQSLFPEEKYKKLWEELNWEVVGYPDLGASDSTLWIGSSGAYTPCHYDTYGNNFYAVISGAKEWTLFSPKDSVYLYPTRVPYEESSVYSSVELEAPNYDKYPQFKNSTAIKCVLYDGDILFIPRQWWHYVKCIDTSLCVNIWCKIEEDKRERVKESLIKIIVTSWKLYENGSVDWLNPNEPLVNFENALEYFKSSVTEMDPTASESIASLEPNQMLNKLVSNQFMDSLIEEIFINKKVD